MGLGGFLAVVIILAMILLLIRLPSMVTFVEPTEDENKPLSPIMRILIKIGYLKQMTGKEKQFEHSRRLNRLRSALIFSLAILLIYFQDVIQ